MRIRCGFLPLLEPLEFLVRSSVLARMGFPLCSVSSRQSHELRTFSPPTKLGACRCRSQTRRCVVSQSGLGTAGVCPQSLM